MLCALATLLLVAACGSDDGKRPAKVGAADAYNALIRWYLGTLPAPTDSSPKEPEIVFVAPAAGKTIAPATQAAVAAEMADMDDVVMVRFTDQADDALDLDVDDQPVKDNGVLLLVEDVPEARPPVDTHVIVYHNENDQKAYSVKIIRSGNSFAATSVTEVAQG
jgi:hypothetical protein